MATANLFEIGSNLLQSPCGVGMGVVLSSWGCCVVLGGYTFFSVFEVFGSRSLFLGLASVRPNNFELHQSSQVDAWLLSLPETLLILH